ncbi:NUDIX domain-containing protein [Ohessyouella blattaphilus]|uniref:NUDIX hydrolase n=1 Tax=Ohessyouella blattaphilus TaxID=2949333 RepID=A0ABT1EKK4_9FIRM|nr:NUDIX hydrolase [Ohessyouella blattaphilus]MCP1111208.1 NUDIX hydrolase [Ohessyouella blattaphilus]MCR8564602.1 NUDIX hydrolase [Ohessyouella blattaphilus]
MANEVRRVKRELAYKGRIIDVYKDYMEFENGNTSVWDTIHHDGATAVLPILPDGRLVLVKQYRNALERDTIEIPAGKLDTPDEDPQACATRELKEETGYLAANMRHLLTIKTTVAFCDENIEVYLASDLRQEGQQLDENEYVEVLEMTLAECKELIYSGKMQDSKTVAAIMAYANLLHDQEI